MTHGLHSVEKVNAMIQKGDTLLLAGDGGLLSQLHRGKWVAGATSRFGENCSAEAVMFPMQEKTCKSS